MHSSTMAPRTRARTRRWWSAFVVAIVCLASLTATAAVSTAAGAQSSKKILGPKNVAKGEPVKVGVITAGRSATLDNQFEEYAAGSITDYLNNYRGGIGGRPIDMLFCTTNAQANPVKAQECANELIGKGAVLIITGSSPDVPAVHTATAAAKVPYFLYGTTDPAVTTDPNYTYNLVDPRAGLYALPISVAKDEKVKKVTAVVIDIPQATDNYTSTGGKQQFADAKIELSMVALPIGQADATPQMAQIANGAPTEVQIVGNDTVCIAAFKGLQANGFDGPMSTLFTCVTDSTRTAVGSYLKGVFVAFSTPVGNPKDPDYKLMDAIFAKYPKGDIPDHDKALNMFSSYMSAIQPLAKMKGEINPTTINSTIKSMDNMKVVAGGGLIYRCNGKAKPDLVAVCTAGGLRTELDAQGQPVLPFEVVGNGPVPD